MGTACTVEVATTLRTTCAILAIVVVRHAQTAITA